MFSFHSTRSYVAPLEFILSKLTFLYSIFRLETIFTLLYLPMWWGEHGRYPKHISRNFVRKSINLDSGNARVHFQDLITFLFVQIKEQTDWRLFQKHCKPLVIAMATKRACVIKVPWAVSLEERIHGWSVDLSFEKQVFWKTVRLKIIWSIYEHARERTRFTIRNFAMQCTEFRTNGPNRSGNLIMARMSKFKSLNPSLKPWTNRSIDHCRHCTGN